MRIGILRVICWAAQRESTQVETFSRIPQFLESPGEEGESCHRRQQLPPQSVA
jgi:hypothetical protein